MRKIIPYLVFNILLLLLPSILFAQDIDINNKVIIEENDDLKPIRPFVNDCCYKVEIDLVPSTDRKSGHLNTHLPKNKEQVPREDNRLKDGSSLKGYDLVNTTGQSRMRSNNPELKNFDMVPRYSQTQLVAVNNEGKIIESVPGESKVFIRNIKNQENALVPTTEKINGEAKFGTLAAPMIPRDQNPLKNGSMAKGYDWVLGVSYLGRMLSVEDRPIGEVPREPFMSNRGKIEIPLEIVPSWNRSFLDCR